MENVGQEEETKEHVGTPEDLEVIFLDIRVCRGEEENHDENECRPRNPDRGPKVCPDSDRFLAVVDDVGYHVQNCGSETNPCQQLVEHKSLV
mmetsp:Transcript_33791/g.66479  ORF Transcript_33791/g.66479 Transcript_33791/m.66479 type:complete len:92 (-) Transcript_33791:1285-1560(-)